MESAGGNRSVRQSRDLAGAGIGLALALALFGLGWLRHSRFWSGFDLAIFDQAVWQISEGRNQISIVDRHVLADHFSPVLYVLSLLYRLVPTVAWLLGAQALAVGMTVVPVRGIARALGASTAAATALVACSAPLLAASLFDFHPSTLAVPFVALTLQKALADEPIPALLAAAAVAACRADLGLVVVAAAMVAGPRTRMPLAGAGGLIAVLGSWLPGRFGETNGWVPHFGHLGDTPADAVLHPWDVAAQLLSSDSLSMLLVWVVAAGCLVVLQPRWMLALVVAGLPVLLSRWEGTGLPWYHYGAPMAVIAIGGTLTTLGSGTVAVDHRANVARWIGPVLALVLASPLSPAAPDRNRVWAWSAAEQATLSTLVDGLGPDERVSADQRLLPHIAHRQHLHIFPLPFREAEGFFAPGSGPLAPAAPDELVDAVIARDPALAIVLDDDFVPADSIEGWSLMRPSEER